MSNRNNNFFQGLSPFQDTFNLLLNLLNNPEQVDIENSSDDSLRRYAINISNIPDFLDFRNTLFNNIPSLRPPRNGLSIFSNRENILVAKRYEDHQYSKAKEYFVNNLKKDNTQDYVSRSLLNIILDLYTDNEEDEYPTLDELVDKVFEYRCSCVYLLNELDIKNMLKDYVSIKGDIPRCREYSYLIEYHIINKTIPSEQELEDFMIRAAEFMFNPEDFYQKDKVHVPALGVDKLPVKNYCKDTCKSTTCSLCQDDFVDEQQIITLLPCKHEFHYNDKECLGNASIKNWLSNNNFCPLCKTKVEVKDN
jgi:hypothetical protein